VKQDFRMDMNGEVHWGREMHIRVWFGNLKESDHFENLSIDGKVLEWGLKEI
jgi:hypothetical protein